MSQFTLGSLMRKNAVQYPHNQVFVSENVSYTYQEANAEVNRIVYWMEDKGVQRGDRVAILMDNGVSYGLFVFAIAKLGAIFVPINIRLHNREIDYILNDCAPKLMITNENLYPIAKTSANSCEVPLYQDKDILDDLKGFASDEPDLEVVTSDIYTIKYTSGTTGFPKGCIATHQNWLWNNNNIHSFIENSSEDSYLALLPLFHVAGFGAFLTHIHYGGKVVFTSGKFDEKEVYELIEREEVSTMFILEPLLSKFLYSEYYDVKKVKTIKNLLSMAGIVSSKIVTDIKNKLQCNYFGIYGSTEASSIVTAINYKENMKNYKSYGYLLPNFEGEIDNISNNPNEEIGELLLRGPSNIQGYWNKEIETKELLKGGWLHTGDIFQRHQDGTLEMIDRKKYLIKTGGENVYPNEVETVLREHPNIADVAVIGIPDRTWGEAIKAFIVLAPGSKTMNSNQIKDWCRDKLTGFKIPKFYEYIDEIPRNHSGKVLKGELQDREESTIGEG
ncbi:AMP-binding protein [Oceanobacillus longus]|uniref:AMP-binding protein n=1 Tax=Oceanobacillus longus TaxID=930120 RepID=A0ABV8H304_9BACI